jgi:hypothetical protein
MVGDPVVPGATSVLMLRSKAVRLVEGSWSVASWQRFFAGSFDGA